MATHHLTITPPAETEHHTSTTIRARVSGIRQHAASDDGKIIYWKAEVRPLLSRPAVTVIMARLSKNDEPPAPEEFLASLISDLLFDHYPTTAA